MSLSVMSNDGNSLPSLSVNLSKDSNFLASILPSTGRALTPDVKPPEFTPDFCAAAACGSSTNTRCVGSYLILDKLSSTHVIETYKAIHVKTGYEFVCKVLPLSKYREVLAPYWRSGSHAHIAEIVEIILGESKAYVVFNKTYEDLHSYIRSKRRLREREAASLFSQITSAVKHCHKRGIILRDVKLRKFVFIDEQRTHLVLEGLEDACNLDNPEDDRLTDKHGCPAYVSPEILTSSGYSGRSADMWSVGVILYTMLFGQYPFHDTVASQLFGKIRRGHYTVPDIVSQQARCLVRSLLRTTPSERLTVFEVCRHPWFRSAERGNAGNTKPEPEQRVPEAMEVTLPGAATENSGYPQFD